MSRSVETGHITVEGLVGTDEKEFARAVAVTRPASLFVALLKERLALKGVTVTGKTRPINLGEKSMPGAGAAEIARLESVPLSDIAAKIMKPSQNMFTEVLLRALGEKIGDKTDPRGTSHDRGIGVIRKFIGDLGIPADAYVPWDGSGLSRHNVVTPSTLITLYTYMAKQSRHSKAWVDSLPIGGVDGTIRNRFKGTAATNNVKAKTGTINQVSGLSGYVTTVSGEKLVFSMLVNGIPDAGLRVSTIDQVVHALAEYDGRID
jgi:D-alanyl-D-alanine carboxypeptidase/D-alanyl-D-alanine-endopeptidase (penicillin-binding protein 4)